MLTLIIFIITASVTSYIDIKDGLILDKVMFPAIIILALAKYFENTLSVYDFVSVVIILIIFLIPVILDMAFGGGDLRFGAFCALFLGLEPIGIFLIVAGLVHVAILFVLKKKSFAFAPAMSISAITAYFIGSL